MLSKPFRRTFRPNDVNYFGYITDERKRSLGPTFNAAG
jgi:hypothetical protein